MSVDINYRSYADVSGVRLTDEDIYPPDGTDWADTVKLSHATDVEIVNCDIYGGKEDVIDMNRYTSTVLVKGCKLFSQGQYALTIKGGTTHVFITDCIFYGNPSSGFEIDLGNWSDQSAEKTQTIVLENCRRADGKPVNVRVLLADRPIVIGGNVRVTVIPMIFVKIWRFFRGLQK